MLRWIAPIVILLASGLMAFALTPADPVSLYVGWSVLAVLAFASYGLGWWVRGKAKGAKELRRAA